MSSANAICDGESKGLIIITMWRRASGVVVFVGFGRFLCGLERMRGSWGARVWVG